MTPTVVLLHGLGRTHRSMGRLAERLDEAGFATVNLAYPSTRYAPEDLVGRVGAAVQECCRDAGTVHFVTHSLGGLLVRAYLSDHELPNLGRIVMLAPPNRGSEVVDRLRTNPVFRWILGPTATELGTSADSFPNRLARIDCEIGVIAGRASVNPFGSALIPGDDDGAVAVASTHLEGMTDFLTLDRSHTFIMRADDTAEQAIHFLRHGRFLHEPDRG